MKTILVSFVLGWAAYGQNTLNMSQWITDTQYRELAAYAPDSIVRLNGYEIGTLSNPSVVLTDADGNVNPITVQAFYGTRD
jgi:hypothetical protein